MIIMKMRGSEAVKEDFKTQIFDIFGTVDLEQLRAIAQKVQLIESEKPHNERGAGRKNSLTPQQLAEMLALHQQGMGATELAKKYGISRQTIYKQLERAQNFSNDPNTMLRLNYMNRNDLCTTIDVDFKHEKIKIKNYTDKIPLRAFGMVENPTWEDFQWFLKDRCFPETRAHLKWVLSDVGVPFYDPLMIIEKTKGKMAEDQQWIEVIHRKAS